MHLSDLMASYCSSGSADIAKAVALDLDALAVGLSKAPFVAWSEAAFGVVVVLASNTVRGKLSDPMALSC